MKKIFILAILAMFSFCAINAQTPEFSVNGNNYTMNKKQRKSNVQETPFTYGKNQDRVYINPETGRCFIKTISAKTGKESRRYLPEKVARDIAAKMGILYVEKQKTK